MLKEFALADAKPTMVYMPDKFTGKLAGLVHWNGIGENDNDGDISLVFRNGYMHHLKDGAFKPEGVIVVNMFPPVDYPNEVYVTQALDSILSKLPIDPKRLFMSGLSAGAEVEMLFAMAASSFVRRLAGIICMSVTHKPCDKVRNSPYLLSHLKNVPIWWLHGDQDVSPHSYARAKLFHDTVKDSGNTHTRFTTLKGVGHGGWNTMTSPTFGSHPDNTYKQSLWDYVRGQYATSTAYEPLEYRPHSAMLPLDYVSVEMKSEVSSQPISNEAQIAPVDTNKVAPASRLHEFVDGKVRELVNGVIAIQKEEEMKAWKQPEPKGQYVPKSGEETINELTNYQQSTDKY